MSELEQTLRASIYHQLAIRLMKALTLYGAHTPNCGVPCSCGYAAEVEQLIAKARAQSLSLVGD